MSSEPPMRDTPKPSRREEDAHERAEDDAHLPRGADVAHLAAGESDQHEYIRERREYPYRDDAPPTEADARVRQRLGWA